ncbi:MAG: DUF1963 domain-containing protein [Pseudomonadota bacterium]
MILHEAIALTYECIGRQPGTARRATEAHLAQLEENIVSVKKICPIFGNWFRQLDALDPDLPLGAELGAAFTEDLMFLDKTFRSASLYFHFGGDKTTTSIAALRAYFAVYCGDRTSYEAMPGWARKEIGTSRLRRAYADGVTHQMGGHGCDMHGDALWEDDLVLLFQIATDEAIGFAWGELAVLQYWIAREDLAQEDRDNVNVAMGID